MTAKDVIRAALGAADMTLLSLVKDLSGDELVAQPTAAGGNHALWVLGHVGFGEEAIVRKAVLGEEAGLSEEVRKKYDMGSTPTPNAADYHGVAELLAQCAKARALTLATLEALSDEEMDAAPLYAADLFKTKGGTLAFLAVHQAFHAGQVADVRRSLGKKPLHA